MGISEVCGGSPAARIKLRRGVGLVLVARVYTSDVVLCGVCASSATSQFQRETLIKGWTSPRSVLFNPFYVASNVINKVQHKRKLRNQD